MKHKSRLYREYGHNLFTKGSSNRVFFTMDKLNAGIKGNHSVSLPPEVGKLKLASRTDRRSRVCHQLTIHGSDSTTVVTLPTWEKVQIRTREQRMPVKSLTTDSRAE